MSVPTASHPTRPAMHFTSREGWINDPLGLSYHDGSYHLFFQHVPGQSTWGPACHWGHATSPDLLTWTEHPIILSPDDTDGGCWSGSIAVEPDGTTTLFYTSVQLDDLDIGAVRVARPTDRSWDHWEKGEVVAELPAGTDANFYRDPYVLRADGGWRMLIGSGRSDGTAVALAHSSPDLSNWRFDGEIAHRDSRLTEPLWTGKVWECPQLLPLDGRWVLTVSVWEPWIPHYEAYAIGDLVDGNFVADTWGRLTYGPSYYAGSAFADADGRRGLIYWLREVRHPHGAWAGANSIPHLLRLDGDRLSAEPHPNLADCRRPADPAALPPVADLEWNVPAGQIGRLKVHAPDGRSILGLAATDGGLEISAGADRWTLPPSRRLRVVLDGPVVEIFGDFGAFAAPIAAADRLAVAVTEGTDLAAYAIDLPEKWALAASSTGVSV